MRQVIATLALLLGAAYAAAQDPLPSWNDTAPKQSIVEFVAKVTKEGSPDFVPPNERIATFDNDGTLWCEKPLPFQLFFALDRVKELAPQHPEWKTKEPFASLLKGDLKTALAGGEHALLQIVMATHAGMTTAEFEQIVKDWLATAKHPKFKKPFIDCVYQPMIELLAYLRANGFKTFIVSGGGIEFMRPWAEKAYGIPPEQVVGSSIKTKFEMRDGKPVLVRLPELNFIDDKSGKPVGINQHIGRRPIAAFGNSDGDREMLEYTQGGIGARFMLLVLHDDAAREYAYGPAQGLPSTKLGAFTQSLHDQAKKDGWTVVLPASVAKNLKIETQIVTLAKQPRPLPPLSGSLGLNLNKMARVHTLFPGVIREIGTLKADAKGNPLPGSRLLEVGDKVEAKYTGMDRKGRVLQLSIRAKDDDDMQQALEEYQSASGGTTKLGALLKEQMNKSE